MLTEAILISIISFFIGLSCLGFLFYRKKMSVTLQKTTKQSENILESARKDADKLVRAAIQEAKEDNKRRKKLFEEESRKRKSDVNRLEKKLKQKEYNLEKKQQQLQTKEEKIHEFENRLELNKQKQIKLISQYEQSIEKNQRSLERVAKMSAEQAKQELIKSLEGQAKKEARKIISQIESDTNKEASEKATHIISLATHRLAGDYVNDATVTVLNLPSDEMKGRIIGREGRNIRAIEQATGVDLIVDDTPEAVILSCFNPERRMIAQFVLEQLIADGRIHPARIEETVERAKKELESLLLEKGEQAAFDLSITDLHPQIIRSLGQLSLRHTGSQSILQHSVETANICAHMASELEINLKLARRAGLLHDIGNAVDQEKSGHHATLGAKFCAKYGEKKEICEAIELHHSDNLLKASSLAVILGAANKLSANRPGARSDTLESYIKRLTEIEDFVCNYSEEISSAYVLQAGREIRVMLNAEIVDDNEVQIIADNIAAKLRHKLTYPGQIRMTVLRESKYSALAT